MWTVEDKGIQIPKQFHDFLKSIIVAAMEPWASSVVKAEGEGRAKPSYMKNFYFQHAIIAKLF